VLGVLATNCKFYFAACIQALSKKSILVVTCMLGFSRTISFSGYCRFCS